MSGAYFEFEEVDSFTTGAVGKPGARTFFLQARQGRTRVAVKCEKQQVAAITQYLRSVLHDLPPADERPVPAALELTEPLEQLFIVAKGRRDFDAFHVTRRETVQECFLFVDSVAQPASDEIGKPDADGVSLRGLG